MPEALALPDVATTTGCIYTMYTMKKNRLRVCVCVCVCLYAKYYSILRQN